MSESVLLLIYIFVPQISCSEGWRALALKWRWAHICLGFLFLVFFFLQNIQALSWTSSLSTCVTPSLSVSFLSLCLWASFSWFNTSSLINEWSNTHDKENNSPLWLHVCQAAQCCSIRSSTSVCPPTECFLRLYLKLCVCMCLLFGAQNVQSCVCCRVNSLWMNSLLPPCPGV